MPKQEFVDASVPDSPASASSQRQTRTSARKSVQTPSTPSSRTSPRVASTASNGTLASTPRSLRRKGNLPNKPPPTRKRPLGMDIEEMQQDTSVSVSRPAASQPAKRTRRTQDAGPPPPATQPLPRPVSPSKPTSVSLSVPVPTAAPAPSSPEAPERTMPKDKGKHRLASRRRSANFWHLDGSVVVQVHNTLFRLHRSRLTQQSAFFADLFAGDDRCVSFLCR
ncbi:hypothetical protein DICSQDRAFT_140700 [Dichomitus squalens LYAD-421 SS1]|uniref:BTB domain-containing protein n=1 Tax=Dichomitus squalens (strain LYAD-421) TaxID=732165 RepID=R7SLK5_DICSQ|nr:uncharacterized protein DICSQDRAFT_140700 [Dichomitus squalens LYAD-421 SS1]EJF57029.1 hypothetical protein DICSQDRAFT_140700 [Dichomitus squalens LYAD-421 SS1]